MTEVIKTAKGTTIGLLSDKDRQVEEPTAKKKAAKKPKK
jgi:hypothetical protein